jgi:hypothetical protein
VDFGSGKILTVLLEDVIISIGALHKMELIRKEIKEECGKLSKMNTNFLDFVEKNLESLKQYDYDDLFELIKLGIEPTELQPWPIFINQKTKNQFNEVGINVFNIIKSIPQRLFSNNVEKISRYYEASQEKIEYHLTGVNDDYLKNLIGRGDFILSPSGLKCIEYNVTAHLGGWQVAILEPFYSNTPIISKFLKEHQVKIRNKNLISILFEHLLNSAVERFPHCDELNIAIVSSGTITETTVEKSGERIFLNQIYGNVLQQKGNGLRGEVYFCDFPHLTIENDCIFCGSKPVHVLLERYHGDIPRRIVEIFKKGNFLLYNGPMTWLLANKLNHAVLSENEDSEVFTSKERDIIKEHIPWTRKLVPGEVTWGTRKYNLYDLLLSHQEKLVIKPSTGVGGEEVYVGRRIPKAQWRDSVNSAIQNRTWLVQEYVESLLYPFQNGIYGCTEHHGVWGLFIFGSQYAGGFLRILPAENTKEVINTRQGATKTVIFEVED